MKLYIDKRFLTLQGKVPVYDEIRNEKYFVHGAFVFGKDYFIEDVNGIELAHVYQKKVSSTGKCIILRNKKEIGEIVPKITFLKPKYAVNGLEWTIEGNFKQDEFVIKDRGNVIVKVGVRILSKGSAFEINIVDGINEVTALACVLAIEGLLETEVLGTAVNSSMIGMMN